MRKTIEIIVFTAIISYGLAFVLSLFCIKYLKGIQSRIKPELFDVHSHKEGTPNVGGIAFLSSTFIFSLIFIPLNKNVSFILFSTALFALLGFIDDIVKIKTKNGDGVSSKLKLFMQFSFGLIIAILGDHLLIINLGWSFLYSEGVLFTIIRIVLIAFVLAYFANAFNITDGLDGLLASISLPIFVLIFLIGLNISVNSPIILLSISMLSSLFAFFHFNKHPAIYFMGDCGSMGLGVFLTTTAMVLNIVPVFLIASLVLSVELFTSLIQIISINKFHKKVFLIAPIHHAFQEKGMNEESIVAQFARYSTICSIIAFFVYSAINR
ncbi:MAG: hypothetical protein JJE21_00210 [Spirochaetaceae bacterium]|nr:hypothetical protein [Spirochaetaceae bacterium]